MNDGSDSDVELPTGPTRPAVAPDGSRESGIRAHGPDSESRLRRLHECSQDGYTVFRPVRARDAAPLDFLFLDANSAAASDLGRTVADLLGRSLLELLPDFAETTVYRALVDVATMGEARTEEHSVLRRGRRRWYRYCVLRLGDELVVTYSDVTAHRQAEASLRFLSEASHVLSRSLDYEATLRVLARLAVPALADWAFVDTLESDGSLRRVASAHDDPSKALVARELDLRFPSRFDAALGVPAALREGRAVLDEAPADAFFDAVATGPAHAAMLRSLGVRSAIFAPLRARERVVGVLTLYTAESKRRYGEDDRALVEDLARRASMAIENAILYRTAQEANRLKDDFLATVSHELRSPLTAILGWARMLSEMPVEPARLRKGIEIIGRNAHAQAQLIEDLLDVSRIISGKLRLTRRYLDLNAVVEAALDSMRPAADAKGVALEASLDPTLGPTVGDPDRIQQIVWNLLSNAVKFTSSRGRVRIETQHEGAHIAIRILDTGRGIAPAFLPFVFDRFRQADAGSTRSHGGLGLGLAIVRHLVELHGGTVRAESAGLGTGATFTVHFPVPAMTTFPHERDRREPAAPNPSTESSGGVLAGLEILVVDDEPDARELISMLLETAGARTRDASCVREALEEVARRRPDAIVADIGMPDDDGYVLIERLRALESRPIPALALSAYARAEDRRRALVAGFQRHVAKPIQPPILVRAVAQIVGRADLLPSR